MEHLEREILVFIEVLIQGWNPIDAMLACFCTDIGKVDIIEGICFFIPAFIVGRGRGITKMTESILIRNLGLKIWIGGVELGYDVIRKSDLRNPFAVFLNRIRFDCL